MAAFRQIAWKIRCFLATTKNNQALDWPMSLTTSLAGGSLPLHGSASKLSAERREQPPRRVEPQPEGRFSTFSRLHHPRSAVASPSLTNNTAETCGNKTGTRLNH